MISWQLYIQNVLISLFYLNNPMIVTTLSCPLILKLMKQKEGAEKAIWLVLDFAEGWAMQETQFPSLGQEDCLEKGMAIHCNILA